MVAEEDGSPDPAMGSAEGEGEEFSAGKGANKKEKETQRSPSFDSEVDPEELVETYSTKGSKRPHLWKMGFKGRGQGKRTGTRSRTEASSRKN